MLKVLIWPGFLLMLLAQWLVPLQMIYKKTQVLNKGLSFKFLTEPIDPSDPFLGKYIVLNFKESSFKITDAKKFANTHNVYVSFSADKNGFAMIKSIDIVQPERTDFLKTKINYIRTGKDSATIYLDYPFDKFYMEEYNAPKAESIYRERNIDSTLRIYALVKVYNGDAVVKDVYVNDSLITEVIKARK